MLKYRYGTDTGLWLSQCTFKEICRDKIYLPFLIYNLVIDPIRKIPVGGMSSCLDFRYWIFVRHWKSAGERKMGRSREKCLSCVHERITLQGDSHWCHRSMWNILSDGTGGKIDGLSFGSFRMKSTSSEKFVHGSIKPPVWSPASSPNFSESSLARLLDSNNFF